MSSTNIKIEVLESAKWEHLPCVYLTAKEIYNIEVSENIETLRLDNIGILLGKQVIYLAKTCYRQYKYNRKTKIPHVQKGSLIKERLNVAKSIMELVAIAYAGNYSNTTIYAKLYYFVEFINLDLSVPFPTNLESARNYLKPFIADSHEKIKKYIPADNDKGQARVGISLEMACQRQKNAIDLLCHHLKLNTTELLQGIKLIKHKKKVVNTTQALYQDELAQEFNYYTTMFRELSTIVLNNKILPRKIVFAERSYWLLPTSSYMKIDQKDEVKGVPYWNYAEGTNYTRYYVEQKRGKKFSKNDWKRRCKTIRDNFIKQNLEWSFTRKTMAQGALRAYFMQFTILTGMNDSVIARLPFNVDFDIKKEAQNFKGIKYRANGKDVHFSIQSEFISDFQLFIKLREYVLAKHGLSSFNRLFFSFETKRKNTVAELKVDGNAGKSAREILSRKAPFKLNSSRKLRVTKGLWVRKGFGEAVSAYVLQHSLSTSMTNYSGNNAIDTSDEFTDYFEWLNEKVLNHDYSVKTETGRCASQHEPEFAEGTPDEFQKCGKGEGCLFCSSYRLHSDETDLRKLFSLKFLVSECATIAKNNEHFEGIYRPLINRIDSLVGELIKREPDLQLMVISVEKSVFEDEELTQYWLRKYETLVDMGVL
jgi:hypothetical protein